MSGEGFENTQTKTSNQQLCPPTQIAVYGQCHNCLPGRVPNSDQTGCIPCPDGQIPNDDRFTCMGKQILLMSICKSRPRFKCFFKILFRYKMVEKSLIGLMSETTITHYQYLEAVGLEPAIWFFYFPFITHQINI